MTTARPHRLRPWHRHSPYFWPLMVGLVARLASILVANIDRAELWEYGDIARLMVSGHGYAMSWKVWEGTEQIFPTAYMPPGPVMLDYVALHFFGVNVAGYVTIFLMHVVMSIAFVWITGRIVETVFQNERLTSAALWSAALYPTFIYATASFGILNPVLLLNGLLLLNLILFSESLRTGEKLLSRSLALGVLGALVEYFRSEAIAVFMLTLVLIAWRSKDALKGRIHYFAIVLLTTCALYAPWVIRNYVVMHHVIIGSTTSGFNFWRGHNRDATGSSWNLNGRAIWTTDTMWHEMMGKDTPDSTMEWKQIAYHQDKALEWIQAHPMLELERTFVKPILLWGVDWNNKTARTPVYIAVYLVTMIVLLAGIMRMRRDKSWQRSSRARDMVSIIVLWCILYTLIVMVFFSVPRFQILMFGTIFPIITLGVDAFWERIRGEPNQPIL